MRSLQRIFATHWKAERDAVDISGLQATRIAVSEPRAGGLSRREFLGGATTGSAIALGTAGFRWPNRRPSIAIVGGGIAGLAAALRLADNGIAATVYESSARVGGRMHSDSRGYWDQGQVSEWCGESIDTDHQMVLALARRFRLPIIDVVASERAGSEDTYFIFGRYYSEAQVTTDFKPVYRALQADLKSAGYPTTYRRSTAAGVALDTISVSQWIDTRVPGGHRSQLGQLLDIAYTTEFGAETTDQSALNLIYLLGSQRNAGRFAIYGDSDGRYRFAGGNEQLPLLIANSLPRGGVKLGWRMSAIVRNTNGSSTLTFDTLGGTRTVRADHVVLALPFAVLRTLDTSRAGFDVRKLRAIRELGRGRNSKLHLQFNTRYWDQRGPWPGIGNGLSLADTGYQNTWDVSSGQAGASGLLVNLTGPEVAEPTPISTAYSDVDSNPQVLRHAQAFLGKLDVVWPGIAQKWNGKATLSLPALDPNLNCSYSYWRVGQYHTIAGYEGVRQGNIHFAGEHCSVDFQGLMEGAVRSGIQAATEITRDLR